MTESMPILSFTTTATGTDTVDPFTSSLAIPEMESGSFPEARWRKRSSPPFTNDLTIMMVTTDTGMGMDITEDDTGTAGMVDVTTTM